MSTALRRLFSDPAARVALTAFVIMRLITAIVAVWSFTLRVPSNPWQEHPIFKEAYDVAFTSPPPLRTLLEPWYRWDTGWYVHIAYYGYVPDNGSIIFGPLYPLSMRLVAPFVGGDYLLAGILISNVCCFLTLILLYKLVQGEFGETIAARTIWVYMLFPAAFFFFAAYTESLFMALLIGAWLAVQRRYYLLGGLLALLASLTRSQAWTLALPFAIISFIEHAPAGNLSEIVRFHLARPLDIVRRSFAVLGGVIGTAAYFGGISLSGLGDVSTAFETIWRTQIVPPWETLRQIVKGMFEGSLQSYDYASVAAFIFCIVILLLTIRRLKPGYWLYVLASLGYILLRRYELYHLHGMLRYALHLFPIFIGMALLLESPSRRRWQPGQIAYLLYALIGLLLQIGLVMLFSQWYWVS